MYILISEFWSIPTSSTPYLCRTINLCSTNHRRKYLIYWLCSVLYFIEPIIDLV